MFVWLFIDLFVFGFNHRGTPTESFPENFVKIQLDFAELFRILKILFGCLFACLFIDLFVPYFENLGTPTGIYLENFVKIQLDLAEILRIRKLDWRDRGGKEKKRGGILLCSGLKSCWK